MRTELLRGLRASLVAHRRQVMTRYHNTLLRADEELSSLETEDVERATEQWDARVLSTLSHVDLRELVQLTAAIRRIDEHHYGTCIECSSPIGERRLHALPATELCVECASADEARAQQPRGA